ncbi:family 16 glycosylhydrolase [Paludibacter sp.]|uniref:family 16 glycosylhydrolase n=1 Tax=Paludibacter sp. TaxID=1898105 RepID=UPI0025CEE540|nr:family 16 glycosylhydrolase [Paludibacter sp.]
MKSFIVILLSIFLFSSCSKSEPTVPNSPNAFSADITYASVNKTDSVNYIVFRAKTKGVFSSISWDFGDGETLQSDTVVTHYFPQKGTYTVKFTALDVLGTAALSTKDVVIAADDPAYVPHKLIWSDEFDGTTLNTSNWVNETNIDVNNEWQKYTNGDNLTIKDGILTITAKKVGTGQKKGDYTSGRINSNGLRTFLYGRMEIRAKLPAGRGTWPATWMLGANIATAGWPACGELDIMEHVGYNPLWVKGSIHTPSSYGNTVNNADYKLTDCESAFHTYGMTWTPSKIEYYIDDPDHPYYTYSPAVKNASNWPFNKPCFFILNLAIGGDWGGAQGVDDSIFPCSMQIDYVRVYNYK